MPRSQPLGRPSATRPEDLELAGGQPGRVGAGRGARSARDRAHAKLAQPSRRDGRRWAGPRGGRTSRGPPQRRRRHPIPTGLGQPRTGSRERATPRRRPASEPSSWRRQGSAAPSASGRGRPALTCHQLSSPTCHGWDFARARWNAALASMPLRSASPASIAASARAARTGATRWSVIVRSGHLQRLVERLPRFGVAAASPKPPDRDEGHHPRDRGVVRLREDRRCQGSRVRPIAAVHTRKRPPRFEVAAGRVEVTFGRVLDADLEDRLRERELVHLTERRGQHAVGRRRVAVEPVLDGQPQARLEVLAPSGVAKQDPAMLRRS